MVSALPLSVYASPQSHFFAFVLVSACLSVYPSPYGYSHYPCPIGLLPYPIPPSIHPSLSLHPSFSLGWSIGSILLLIGSGRQAGWQADMQRQRLGTARVVW